MLPEPVISLPTCRFRQPGAEAGPLCHCTGVSEATVQAAVVAGVDSLIGVMTETGAGTGCRACHCRINRVLQGLPAKCGGRFDLCQQCGCIGAICRCEAA